MGIEYNAEIIEKYPEAEPSKLNDPDQLALRLGELNM